MDLESFGGFDTGEGMNEAAFEAFKERMKAASAQIAAIKKEEGKHKKKEQDLVKILLKFIKTSHKKDLTLLISRALEQNIPANFILAIVLLGNEDIQKETGNLLMLETSEATPDEKALIFFGADKDIPLSARIQLDNWLKAILYQAEEYPQKLLKFAYEIVRDEDDNDNKEIKTILFQLSTFIIRDFLEENKVDEPYRKLYEFSKFFIKGVLDRTAENLKARNLIGDAAADAENASTDLKNA
jgi:hypothetical protein